MNEIRKIAGVFLGSSLFCLISSIIIPINFYRKYNNGAPSVIYVVIITCSFVSAFLSFVFFLRWKDTLLCREYKKIIQTAYIMIVIFFPISAIMAYFVIENMKKENVKSLFLNKQ